MSTIDTVHERFPSWVLFLAPLVILGILLGILYTFSPVGDIEALADADTGTVILTMTIIGSIAGFIPVLIGMLWYPFLRQLRAVWIYAALALSLGVLTFAGVEMFEGIADNAGSSVTIWLVAAAGIIGAFSVLEAVSSRGLTRTGPSTDKSGLQVAYIIAIGLGLHSIGEGLAIGTAFAQGDGRLVILLVIAFLLDNITEGPTIVAAVASEQKRPPLFHFLIMGLIAGGPVILGGWVGTFADSALLAALFFAIGLGAILQVIWEVASYIGVNLGGSVRSAITRPNIAAFIVGFVFMILLDEVFIDQVLL